MFAALAIGAIGFYIGLQWMFFLVVGLCVVSLLFLKCIRPEHIDYDLARGADGEDAGRQATMPRASVPRYAICSRPSGSSRSSAPYWSFWSAR